MMIFAQRFKPALPALRGLRMTAFLLGFAVLAHGAATVITPRTTVTLLSESLTVAPGQTLWLGLHFELRPH